MSYRVLCAEDAFWRPSSQMGVMNTDLSKQLQAKAFGARLWRLQPGQASTRHRHRATTELYVRLEGTGPIRIERDLVTMTPLNSVLVEPNSVRQLFNDTGAGQLWLVFGAPDEAASTLELSPDDLAWHYPDGPKALTPELESARRHQVRAAGAARARPDCRIWSWPAGLSHGAEQE